MCQECCLEAGDNYQGGLGGLHMCPSWQGQGLEDCILVLHPVGLMARAKQGYVGWAGQPSLQACSPPHACLQAALHALDGADLIRDEDLLAVGAAPSRRGRLGRQSSGSVAAPPQKEAAQLLADMSGLSARERAAALRKAKSGLKRGMSMEQPCSPTKKSRLAGGEAGPAQQQQQQQQGLGGGEGGSAAASEGVQGEAAAPGPGVEQEWEEILAGRCARQGCRWKAGSSVGAAGQCLNKFVSFA